MRFIALITAFLFISGVNAQDNNQSSLQASLNKALVEQNQEETNLVTFEANVDLEKNAVQLKWKSSPETTTNKYIIEKSLDKLNWKEVTAVYGAAHKAQVTEYFHIDFEPMANLSYYRIRLMHDNNDSYSNVVPVNYVKSEDPSAGMNLDPSCAIDNKVVTIAFEDVFEKEILMVVRDQKGEEYYSIVEINIENEELVAVPMEREIPTGDYLIVASSENQLYSQNVSIR